MKDHFISVILSSYNQPNCLKLVLEGFCVQKETDFEIIVADDGSDKPTLDLIEEYRARGSFELTKVSQEHTHFRKARILNLAARESRGEQLVFCDGDCLPFPDFLAVHKVHFFPGAYAVGGYIYLDLEESRSLSREAVRRGKQTSFLGGRRARKLRWVHIKNRIYAFTGRRNKPKILGGNFSVDREAFFSINGFDERFDGFSGEDSDIRNRFNSAGIRAISLWNKAFVCHLDHALDPNRCHPDVVRGKRDKDLLVANETRQRIETGVDRH